MTKTLTKMQRNLEHEFHACLRAFTHRQEFTNATNKDIYLTGMHRIIRIFFYLVHPVYPCLDFLCNSFIREIRVLNIFWRINGREGIGK